MNQKINPLWKFSLVILGILMILIFGLIALLYYEVSKGGYMAGFGVGMMLYYLSPLLICVSIIGLITVIIFIKKHNLKKTSRNWLIVITIILISPILYYFLPNFYYYIQEKTATIPLSREQTLKLMNECKIKYIERTGGPVQISLNVESGNYPFRTTDGNNFEALRDAAHNAYQECGKIIVIDRTSAGFEAIKRQPGYQVTDNKAFYNQDFIGAADPETFKRIDEYYAKDASSVFFWGKIIPDADPNTFISIADGYAKDANRVYWKGHIMQADPATFTPLGLYAKDAYRVYYANRILNGAYDPKSFTSLDEGYAKDAVNAYFLSNLIPNIDSKTFEFLGDYYAKDAKNVYYQGTIVSEADPNTFIFIGETSYPNTYGKDALHVFNRGRIVPNVDPANCIPENLEGCKRVN